MRNKVIFISGPYRASTERELVLNIREAERAAVEVWMLGGIALTPHLNSAHLAGIIEDEEWLIGYLELLRRCDAVYAIGRYETSEGANLEIQEASKIGIPVFHTLSNVVDFLVQTLPCKTCGEKGYLETNYSQRLSKYYYSCRICDFTTSQEHEILEVIDMWNEIMEMVDE